MISKEALRDLRTYFDYHKDEQFKTIEKDLEILEILRKHACIVTLETDDICKYEFIFDKNIHQKDYKTIKEWLRNGR